MAEEVPIRFLYGAEASIPSATGADGRPIVTDDTDDEKLYVAINNANVQMGGKAVVEHTQQTTGNPHSLDYSDVSGADGATDVTGAELEELTDGSKSALHEHQMPYDYLIAPSGGNYTSISAYVADSPAQGDVIALAPGTYTETSNITLQAGVTMFALASQRDSNQPVRVVLGSYSFQGGAGSRIDGIYFDITPNSDSNKITLSIDTIFENCVLDYSGTVGSQGIYFNSGCIISNTRILGNNYLYNALECNGAENFSLRDIYISGVDTDYGRGVYLLSPNVGGSTIQRITMEDFATASSANDAVYLSGNTATKPCSVEHLHINGGSNVNVGLYIYSDIEGAMSVSDCSFTQCFIGMQVTSGRCALSNVTAYDCDRGFYFSGAVQGSNIVARGCGDGTTSGYGMYIGSWRCNISNISISNTVSGSWDIRNPSGQRNVISNFHCAGDCSLSGADNVYAFGTIEGDLTIGEGSTDDRNVFIDVKVFGSETDGGIHTKWNSRVHRDASGTPSSAYDVDDGYERGDFWIQESTDSLWVCVDNSTGAAVWTQLVPVSLDLSGHNVTELDDVSSAGSGQIITSGERTNLSTAYNHSQVTTGNPHSLDAADVGAAPSSHGSANHSGTIGTASQISDFDTEVSNNTNVSANTAARHAESHTIASHSDTTATGAELNTLTGGGNADALHSHSAPSHTIASHSDTSATGAELDSLTDGSKVTLHKHQGDWDTLIDAGGNGDFSTVGAAVSGSPSQAGSVWSVIGSTTESGNVTLPQDVALVGNGPSGTPNHVSRLVMGNNTLALSAGCVVRGLELYFTPTSDTNKITMAADSALIDCTIILTGSTKSKVISINGARTKIHNVIIDGNDYTYNAIYSGVAYEEISIQDVTIKEFNCASGGGTCVTITAPGNGCIFRNINITELASGTPSEYVCSFGTPSGYGVVYDNIRIDGNDSCNSAIFGSSISYPINVSNCTFLNISSSYQVQMGQGAQVSNIVCSNIATLNLGAYASARGVKMVNSCGRIYGSTWVGLHDFYMSSGSGEFTYEIQLGTFCDVSHGLVDGDYYQPGPQGSCSRVYVTGNMYLYNTVRWREVTCDGTFYVDTGGVTSYADTYVAPYYYSPSYDRFRNNLRMSSSAYASESVGSISWSPLRFRGNVLRTDFGLSDNSWTSVGNTGNRLGVRVEAGVTYIIEYFILVVGRPGTSTGIIQLRFNFPSMETDSFGGIYGFTEEHNLDVSVGSDYFGGPGAYRTTASVGGYKSWGLNALTGQDIWVRSSGNDSTAGVTGTVTFHTQIGTLSTSYYYFFPMHVWLMYECGDVEGWFYPDILMNWGGTQAVVKQNSYVRMSAGAAETLSSIETQ